MRSKVRRLGARSKVRRLGATRGYRKGYWGIGGESFSGGSVGEDLSSDSAGGSGVREVLGGFEEFVIVGVAFHLQCSNSSLNVGCVILEKAIPPYVSIQSRVFQL